MPRFVIDLGDIEMNEDDQRALSGALQKVALGHLAGLRWEKPVAIRFPWEWLGLIARRNFDEVLLVEKQIAEHLGGAAIGRSK